MNSGMLIVHFRVPTESVFFILAFNLMIKTFLTYKYKTKWTLFAIGTILGNIFEWSVYLSIISLNNVLLFYLIVNCVVHIVIIVISYLNEINYRNEFLLRRNLDKEIKYANDILYNMSQGFLTYNNKLLFINKSMKRILNYFNCDRCEIKDTYPPHPDKVQIKSNNILLRKLSEEYIRPTESGEELTKNKHPQFQGRILETNVTPITKSLIERLFSNITEYSSELPNEILEKFDLTYSEEKKKFDLDTFYNCVKEKQIFFSSFTCMGIINLICPEDLYPNKKYQVMFRVIQNDSQDNYLEFMLNDASELVQHERDQAIVNSRSIYLSKIAHEFKNPISSIMELSTKISEESQEYNFNSQRQNSIKTNASYIIKLCNLMIQFLKDYTLFTGLKFKCDGCNEGKINVCKICLLKKLCEKCKLCKNCEDKNETIFDYLEVTKGIVKTFKSLGRHEKQEDAPVFKEIYEIKPNESIVNSERKINNSSINSANGKDSLIKTNKEILYSAFYNIVFYTYKTSLNKGEVKIIINKNYHSENPYLSVTQFVITTNSLLIDSNFLKILYSNDAFRLDTVKNQWGNNTMYQDYSSDTFNKYFEIYVAFYMVKKLGGQLKIESTREETKFYFEILNSESQIELNAQKNLMQLIESNNVPFISDTSLQISNLESGEKTIIYDEVMKFSYNNFNDILRTEVLELPQRMNNFKKSIKSKFGNEQSLPILENPNLFSNGQVIDIKKISILIVDDEALIRNTLKRHFTNITKSNPKLLFETAEAANCFQAINILYEKFNENIFFDLIIIDEYMPHMKGSTLIKLLKQITSENNFYKINIISHTAFDSNEKRQFILDSGADYILGKPVLFTDFQNLVLKVISS
jgi:CheY-like chemotaxis protein